MTQKKFQLIWDLARPYYEKGRPMDIEHIKWMMIDAVTLCVKEGLDRNLLLPLVILHDVGYSNLPKDNPFKLDLRKAHMEEGAKIATGILAELGYEKEIIEKVSHMISIHDNWALGDHEIYRQDEVLGSFNDLDFMWMATPKGFPALKIILNKTAEEMIDYLKSNEKITNRPFVTETAKKLFDVYMADRLDEINGF